MKNTDQTGLDGLAAMIAGATGCPLYVARDYLRAFLHCPEAQQAVIVEAQRRLRRAWRGGAS